MGRIYDALKKAERERRGLPVDDRPEPTLLLDMARPPASSRIEPTFGPPEGNGSEVPLAALGTRAILHPPHPSLVAVVAPTAAAAEHLRALKTRLGATYAEQGYRTLLVTSPGRGDGKTTVASNLALLLAAEIGRRVILVDADLRQPRVHALFGAVLSPGLSDAALGGTPWSQAAVECPWNGLFILSAGTPVGNPVEVLNGPGGRRLLADLRQAFDYVVVDAPPVLPVADARVLASLVDGVLLVARDHRTPREAVPEAVEALAGGRVLGVVLNGARRGPLTHQSYYDGY